ncbi:glycosyltransferase family 2 protein [Microbacterium sp. 1.5R]|uniref:glycosyltransferase family 2 protein n=1 Tax=Microbacterium sp. 1.5R TaxID=1916917 RepID=UPI0011A9DCA8|nr:glycosyltransferase family A protein [Microbacterium sp. 1.5R]
MHAADHGDQATSGDAEGVSLVVAIPTFKRPERLVQTLRLVGAQLAPLVADGGVRTASILVIDNDPAESARPFVEGEYAGVATTYVAEATPGIPAVRNRALDESTAIDLLSFIDDDEVPLEGWISSLLETWAQSGHPAAVMGRVVSLFEPDADPWVLESGLFRRPERPTGTEISVAATGNLLLDLNQVRRSGVRFDERIGLGGGSDTLFSMGLKKTGARLVWCNESVAEDTVEPERQTRPWALKRSFSHGNVSVLVQLRLEQRATRRAVIRAKGIAGGAARIVAGYARHLRGRVTRSVRHDARGLRLAYRGAGMISASVGQAYSAYSRPVGAP